MPYWQRTIPQREYRYRIGFQKPPYTILAIIILNIIAYMLEHAAPEFVIYTFGLVPGIIVRKFYFWQPITYMFLHGGFFHLFFNMFALYIFGRDLLLRWGAGKFLLYYFFTGIGAGICAFIFTDVPTIGASGAVYGLLLAYAMAFPNRVLLLYFFIPMKAKYLVILFGLVELFASITSFADGIAHIAHLGGMVFGALLLFIWTQMKRLHSKKPDELFKEFTILRPKKPDNIDELLDKILMRGVGSLTPSERKKLVKAGKFISQQAQRKRT